MKQPGLSAEDQETFHACIQPLPDGQYQASWHARLHQGAEQHEEVPGGELCASKTSARARVHREAASRHFKKIIWKDEYSRQAG